MLGINTTRVFRPRPLGFHPSAALALKNAMPSYRHAKSSLGLEFTVTEDDTCGLDVPMNEYALVKKFYRRHELPNALNCELSNAFYS